MVTAPFTASGSTQKSCSVMSAKRAVAPASRMALRVATKVNGLVSTSSPGERSSTFKAATSAVVPLFTAMAWRVPTSVANSASRRATIGPCAIMPDRMTSIARRSASALSRTAEMGING